MLKINSTYQNLIPALSAEEYAGLEASIQKEGLRDAIVTLVDGTIIDGHNRYKICTEHNIPYHTVTREFENEAEVLIWIVGNQLYRRNITSYVHTELSARLQSILSTQAKKHQGTRNDLCDTENIATSLKNSQNFCHNCDKSEISQNKSDTLQTMADMAHVSRNTMARSLKIQALADEVTKQKLRDGELSINQVYNDIRKEEKKQERAEAIEQAITEERTSERTDIFTTEKKYRVVYADPPWSYNDKQDTAKLGGAVKFYPTMPLQDICALPVKDITEKDAVLFLWVTSPMLEECFSVINAWGFKYKSSFVWDKVKHNMGHYNSVRHEFLLIATKGSCTPDVQKLFDSVVSIERAEHSKKPKEFREYIDTLYPCGNRIELFAREASEKWDVWGNMV